MATQTPVPAHIDRTPDQTTGSRSAPPVFEVLQDWITTTDHKKIG